MTQPKVWEATRPEARRTRIEPFRLFRSHARLEPFNLLVDPVGLIAPAQRSALARAHRDMQPNRAYFTSLPRVYIDHEASPVRQVANRGVQPEHPVELRATGRTPSVSRKVHRRLAASTKQTGLLYFIK